MEGCLALGQLWGIFSGALCKGSALRPQVQLVNHTKTQPVGYDWLRAVCKCMVYIVSVLGCFAFSVEICVLPPVSGSSCILFVSFPGGFVAGQKSLTVVFPIHLPMYSQILLILDHFPMSFDGNQCLLFNILVFSIHDCHLL